MPIDICRAVTGASRYSLTSDSIDRAIDLTNTAEQATQLISSIEEVVRLYRDPSRAYHSYEHLYECLMVLDALANTAIPDKEDVLMLWFALLFHDAVYIPQRVDNEWASAELADMMLSAAGISTSRIDIIRGMIMATGMDAEPANELEAITKDIDCCRYIRSIHPSTDIELQIRQEYSWYDSVEYESKRKAFLRRMYNRPFFSELFSSSTVSILYAQRNILGCTTQCHPHVGIAGTFDRLHDGHKNLILEGLMVANHNGTLTIGVMDDSYARQKAPGIQPIDTRVYAIRDYLYDRITSLDLRNVQCKIQTFGDPEYYDESIDILVMGEEAEPRANAIVNSCVVRGIPPPMIHTIRMQRDDDGNIISSTRLREGIIITPER
jgi:phosphopantetheine adenylyltransferase/predicted metal-dependent HD superfamily phosphohydrolase